PAQVLAKELPNRLKNWLKEPVPPKGDRGAWAAKGRLLLQQARISSDDWDPAQPDPSNHGSELSQPSTTRSKLRSVIVALALAATAITGMFPPWTSIEYESPVTAKQIGVERDAGFTFLFTPPSAP